MTEAARKVRSLIARQAGDRALFLQRARTVDTGSTSPDTRHATWRLATLAGRLTELSSPGAAGLTLAFSLVLQAQQAEEPVGWLTTEASSFFPPDVEAFGIDLQALVVVRLPATGQIPRAAEHLARSGAFALLVLDLVRDEDRPAQVPVPLQMRLLGLAQKHRIAVLCLTRKRAETPSLGSLVSLRAEAFREQVGPDSELGDVDKREGGISTFRCTAQILKDKRCGPGWTHSEVCRGPDGLC